MADQLLVNVVTVTLAGSATTIVPHGLKVAGKGVVPTQVIPDCPTTIGILNVNTLGVEFANHGSVLATAKFRIEYDHSIHADGAPTLAWGGWNGVPSSLPPSGPAGGDLNLDYPNPIVIGLNGRSIDLTAPAAGDYWRFDGDTWRHTLVAPGDPVAIYGAFSSDVTQPISNSPVVVSYNTTEDSNGVSVVAGTRLTVTESGVYSLTISPQLAHGGGGIETILFWLRINGANVVNSTSSFEIGNNLNRTLPFMEIVTPMNAGQYAEWVFMSQAAATNLRLEYFPAVPGPSGYPAIPSVIANVKRIGSI